MNRGGDVSAALIAHMRRMRKRRGWTATQLAELVGSKGASWTANTVYNLETRQGATLTVDDVVVVAGAFELSIDAFISAALNCCPQCSGMPPVGYTCNTCGVEAGDQ